MRPCQYIFIDKSLGMSAGKMAAQAAHASVEGYRLSCGLTPHQPQEDREFKEPAVVRNWYKGGHYMKLVMEAQDAQQLWAIQGYLAGRGFRSTLVIDEGHTEGTEFITTALATEIVDKDNSHVSETFGNFKLYRDPPRLVVLESTGKMNRDDREVLRTLVNRGDIEQAKALALAKEAKSGHLSRFIDWLGRPPR